MFNLSCLISKHFFCCESANRAYLLERLHIEFLLIAQDDITIGLVGHCLLLEVHHILHCHLVQVLIYLLVQIIVQTQFLHSVPLADDAHPYVSHLHKLVNATKINIIARDVKKGKVKSLFALNAKEVDCEHDSVWHDIYGMTGVRDKKIAEALAFALDTNSKNVANEANDAKADAFNAIMELYKKNSANAAVNAAL